MKKKCHLFSLPIFSDKRGSLCVIEFKDLFFKPVRSYFLYKSESMRGGHAHKKEKEIFVCVSGSFNAKIHDGAKFYSYKLNKPGDAIFVDAMEWHEFDNFSASAILLAFSSIPFDNKKGYITDFEQFKSLCKKNI